MSAPAQHYKSDEADSARWNSFELREGDVIISTPAKSGTTWTQLLVALLIFDGPNFPDGLGRLSPWLDLVVTPVEETFAHLSSQQHRRVIKTHTPLDGLPMRDDIRYVCVGRDPRDAALSMVHHRNNLDWPRIQELNGGPLPDAPHRALKDHFDAFIQSDDANQWNLTSIAHHYRTFWQRRSQPNVGLFHFSRYLHDLPAEVLRLAHHLGIPLSEARARELARDAQLDAARKRASELAPDAHLGVWKDPAQFFRAGSEGEGMQQMTPAQRATYNARVSQLMEQELLQWVHTGALHAR